MSQVTKGAQAILSHPVVYETWLRVVGGKHGRTALVRDHVAPTAEASIIDLGCGTGDLLDYLPESVEYLGIDISSAYIERARDRFGARARFRIGDVTEINDKPGAFDLVLAFGVLHHLDDAGADRLFHLAGSVLNARGRTITVDAAFTSDQSAVARAIIRRDRGRHVRTPVDYSALAARSFGNVVTTVRSDLLRVPYTHCVLECDSPLRRDGS